MTRISKVLDKVKDMSEMANANVGKSSGNRKYDGLRFHFWSGHNPPRVKIWKKESGSGQFSRAELFTDKNQIRLSNPGFLSAKEKSDLLQLLWKNQEFIWAFNNAEPWATEMDQEEIEALFRKNNKKADMTFAVVEKDA